MRILFWISVIVSGVITIAGFTLINITTYPFDPMGENFNISNGNPGLTFVLFPMLIIMYFIFIMMIVFEKIHDHYRVNSRIFQMGYAIIFFMLISITIYRKITFRSYLNGYFEYDVGYINPFSNHLLFNFWTFVAFLCFSGFVSFFLRKQKKGDLNGQKI